MVVRYLFGFRGSAQAGTGYAIGANNIVFGFLGFGGEEEAECGVCVVGCIDARVNEEIKDEIILSGLNCVRWCGIR